MVKKTLKYNYTFKLFFGKWLFPATLYLKKLNGFVTFHSETAIQTREDITETLMDVLNIRYVHEHDLNGCYALESASYTTEGATREKIRKRIKVFPGGFLVAVLKGTVVGLINSASTDTEDLTNQALKDMVGHDRNGRNMVIFSLAVLPQFRGMGISGKLMKRFIEVSRGLKKEKILLLCKYELIPYYQKFGFLSLGRSKSAHGGFSWYEMCLPLNTA
jgi:predicted N-acetyltransferase YhbS